MLGLYESLNFADENFAANFHIGLFLRRILSVLFLIITVVLSVLMTMFSKFHFKLLFHNKTTIENLEKKKKPYHSEWDIGSKRNFYQVFGRLCIMWPFPFMLECGRPVGDGIEWERFGDTLLSLN